MRKVAAAEAAVEMPPAAPTRTGTVYPWDRIISSLKLQIRGTNEIVGRLSV